MAGGLSISIKKLKGRKMNEIKVNNKNAAIKTFKEGSERVVCYKEFPDSKKQDKRQVVHTKAAAYNFYTGRSLKHDETDNLKHAIEKKKKRKGRR